MFEMFVRIECVSKGGVNVIYCCGFKLGECLVVFFIFGIRVIVFIFF